MAQESQIPQQLMTAALLHFESGVPIADCDLQGRGHRDRLARVHHVYFQWIKNPYLDVFELFKQMAKGTGSDRHSEWRMAQRDKMLFEFVRDHVALGNRRQDEAMVRAAAYQSIRIGMETDNVNALTKGGSLLKDVAHLDQPESEQADMSKAHFISPVVTTHASEVDSTKIDYDDQQSLDIMNEFNAYIDPKRQTVNDKVALLEAKGTTDSKNGTTDFMDYEQDRNESDEQ
jgi:hypothetical protein